MLDEKPLGAATFSEKPGPSHFLGCPRTGDRCVQWREGTGEHAKGQSKFMGQNHPGHLLRSQRSGLPESKGRANVRPQVPRVRKQLEQLELSSRGWALQGGRGSEGHLGAAERVSLN